MDWGSWLLGWFLNWLPTLLVLALVAAIYWRLIWRKGYGTPYQRDHMEQVKRQNELLERIATALEKNNSK